MPTKKEFEAMILDAITSEGTLMTDGDKNGVMIDGHGPDEGNVTQVEGYYTHDGHKAYFIASLAVELEEYSPEWDDEDDIDREED